MGGLDKKEFGHNKITMSNKITKKPVNKKAKLDSSSSVGVENKPI